MEMIQINPDLCSRDRLCVTECPTGIIRLENKADVPVIVSGSEAFCLRCGHCVAVCPTGALNHTDTPLADCPELDAGLALNPAQMKQFLRSRRSVRVFKNRTVDRKDVENLIKLASHAPTGSNAQMVQWRMFDNPDRLHDLASQTIGWMKAVLAQAPDMAPPYLPRMIKGWEQGRDVVLRKAPVLVVATADASVRSGAADIIIALSYLDLAAPVFGLGTCWAGLLYMGMKYSEELRKSMGIEESTPYYYPLMLGYNQHRYHRLPARKPPQINWQE